MIKVQMEKKATRPIKLIQPVRDLFNGDACDQGSIRKGFKNYRQRLNKQHMLTGFEYLG